MDHIPMMDQDRMEEGCCCCGSGGSACQSHQQRNDAGHFMQHTRMMQLTRFIVTAMLVMFVVTVLLALMVVFIFVNRHGLFGYQEHTPSAEPLPGASAQQQKQDIQHPHPSALLTYSPSTKDQEDLVWEDKVGNAYLRGDFSYCNANLTVPRNGLYRVYLQITYGGVGDPTDVPTDDSPLRLYHVVYRFRESYPTNFKLLSAVHTVHTVKFWQKSMYSAASFELKAKDKLWVHSSHPKLIVEKTDQVFFGVDFQYE